MENRLGMLAPGYLADFIVLEQYPFAINSHELIDLHPVGTMVNGEWVWRE